MRISLENRRSLAKIKYLHKILNNRSILDQDCLIPITNQRTESRTFIEKLIGVHEINEIVANTLSRKQSFYVSAIKLYNLNVHQEMSLLPQDQFSNALESQRICANCKCKIELYLINFKTKRAPCETCKLSYKMKEDFITDVVYTDAFLCNLYTKNRQQWFNTRLITCPIL